ncbi:MAG: YhcN/YlaJ family sporulation lipoprotein [Bacillaceae bacterium]|nr:YhcN/YlaJ family sporulation lipoprotein [Bacillaceae bacterium]
MLMITLAACQLANEPPANEAAPSPGEQPDQTQRVEQTAPREQNNNETAQETAERLVRLAREVPGVKGATAVVAGNTAVVGIDVKQSLDRTRVGTIKYSVAEALKEDPDGARALVTADPDIVQRLREMNQEIQNGRPIAGIAEELADIVGRIIPQMPRDVQRREQPNDTTNEQRINQEESPNQTDPSGNKEIKPNQ